MALKIKLLGIESYRQIYLPIHPSTQTSQHLLGSVCARYCMHAEAEKIWKDQGLLVPWCFVNYWANSDHSFYIEIVLESTWKGFKKLHM